MTPAWIRATDYSENSPPLIWPQIKANSGQSLGGSWTKQTQMSCLEQCLFLKMGETFGCEFFSNPYMPSGTPMPDSKLSNIFEERIGDCTSPVKCHRAMPKTVEWNEHHNDLKKTSQLSLWGRFWLRVWALGFVLEWWCAQSSVRARRPTVLHSLTFLHCVFSNVWSCAQSTELSEVVRPTMLLHALLPPHHCFWSSKWSCYRVCFFTGAHLKN